MKIYNFAAVIPLALLLMFSVQVTAKDHPSYPDTGGSGGKKVDLKITDANSNSGDTASNDGEGKSIAGATGSGGTSFASGSSKVKVEGKETPPPLHQPRR